MVKPSDIHSPLIRAKGSARYYRYNGLGFVFNFGVVAVHDLRGSFDPLLFTTASDLNEFLQDQWAVSRNMAE